MNSQVEKKLVKNLLKWFQENSRNLPWRKNRTPYRIWLSEIMLQQTRVDSVIPYFLRFTKKWPEVGDLAKAPLDQVLKEWEGLGYYSRARNLHKTAQIIHDSPQQCFPKIPKELQKLPGIGTYTAGAISSLAFGFPAPAIDGNVVRVFSRIYAKNFLTPQDKNYLGLKTKIKQLIPKEQPGKFNEALMELGATICTPKNFLCKKCPLKKYCKAFQLNKIHLFPKKTTKPKVQKRTLGIAIIEHKNKILIHQNPPKGIWGGLWGFPSIEISIKKPSTKALIELNQTHLKKELGFSIKYKKSLPMFHHQLSHRLLTLHPKTYRLSNYKKRNSRIKKPWVWVYKEELKNYGLSIAHRKIASQL